MKIAFLVFLFFFTSCTQNFISYIRSHEQQPLMNMEEMLLQTGLINTSTDDQEKVIPPQKIRKGILIPPNQQLKKNSYTLEVDANSRFQITVNTKNYLIASPYFSSPNIIYLADESTPNQGDFYFLAGEDSGEIRIRAYDANGALQEEVTWYIEIKSSR